MEQDIYCIVRLEFYLESNGLFKSYGVLNRNYLNYLSKPSTYLSYHFQDLWKRNFFISLTRILFCIIFYSLLFLDLLINILSAVRIIDLRSYIYYSFFCNCSLTMVRSNQRFHGENNCTTTHLISVSSPVSYTHLTLPTIYSV